MFRVRMEPLDDPYAHLPMIWSDVIRKQRGMSLTSVHADSKPTDDVSGGGSDWKLLTLWVVLWLITVVTIIVWYRQRRAS